MATVGTGRPKRAIGDPEPATALTVVGRYPIHFFRQRERDVGLKRFLHYPVEKVVY
jgi:hypothetical protein